jgi:hypothetical protein
MSFTSTQNKGFRIKFENGFSISVQWGTMNYCERKSFTNEAMLLNNPWWKSQDAEIAVFKNNNEKNESDDTMLPIGDNDSVIGWCSPEKVAQIMNIVSTSKNEYEIIKRIKSWEQ